MCSFRNSPNMHTQKQQPSLQQQQKKNKLKNIYGKVDIYIYASIYLAKCIYLPMRRCKCFWPKIHSSSLHFWINFQLSTHLKLTPYNQQMAKFLIASRSFSLACFNFLKDTWCTTAKHGEALPHSVSKRISPVTDNLLRRDKWLAAIVAV